MSKNQNSETYPPISRRTISVRKGNDVEQIPALNKYWAVENCFPSYHTLNDSNGKIKSGTQLEEWVFRANIYRDGILHLLSRPHHVFWSYLLYQKSALPTIISFLRLSTPFYLNVIDEAPENVIKLYEEISTIILRIIFRIITQQESESCWILKDHLRELIYSNFLITVPMLFDLILAVGNGERENVGVLKSLFNQLFEIEPRYKNDLMEGMGFFREAFQSIQAQAENGGFDGAGGGGGAEISETPYDDVVLYTLDCSYTLSLLLESYPDGCIACDKLKIGQCLASFYSETLPFLYKNISTINPNAESLKWLNQARIQLLTAFHTLTFSFIERILADPSRDSLSSTKSYIELLNDCLSERCFVIDYQAKFPIDMDADILSQTCKEAKDLKLDYVVDAFQNMSKDDKTPYLSVLKKNQDDKIESTQSTTSVSTQMVSKSNDKNKVSNDMTKTSSSSSSSSPPRDIDAEVSLFLDMFSDLGTGFIHRLLRRYDNVDEAIAALLESNLPPDLENADRLEVFDADAAHDKFYESTGIKRFNIYDGDQYDVMTRDNPQCIIKQGKGFPNLPKTANQLLDDKSDLDQVRHRYREYDMISEDENKDDEYDDEYDDSYEALLESEGRLIKKQNNNNVTLNDKTNETNRNSSDLQADSNEEHNYNESPSSSSMTQQVRDKRLDFCENPEVIRARYEAKRQTKMANSSRSKKAFDVVGAPKGQGQDDSTLRNRNKKEVNKSSRANHNRKAGAAYKRSKGML